MFRRNNQSKHIEKKGMNNIYIVHGDNVLIIGGYISIVLVTVKEMLGYTFITQK